MEKRPVSDRTNVCATRFKAGTGAQREGGRLLMAASDERAEETPSCARYDCVCRMVSSCVGALSGCLVSPALFTFSFPWHLFIS